MDGRAEAERWLLIAEKLLAARDLLGSKSFAIRARESDPRLEEPYQILAVVDTLLAGSQPINNTLYDWYGILQLHSRTQDFELIAQSYRRLALLLNPNKNRFSFSDQALQLVLEAWNVLSDPFKKSLYDNELTRASSSSSSSIQGLQTHQNQAQFHFQQQQQQQQQQLELEKQEQERRDREREESERKARENERIRVLEEQQRREREKERESCSSKGIKNAKEGLSFWTACPYCYNLYEYGKEYEDCCLRCQNCERAFHAVRVPNPVPEDGVVGEYFCCWGFFPLGFDSSGYRKGKNLSNWSPITQMFSCPIQGGGGFGNVEQKKRPKVVFIDDDGLDFPERSDDDDDDDWNSTRDKMNKKKKKKKENRSGSGRGRGRPYGSKNVRKVSEAEKLNNGIERGAVQESVDSGEVQDGVVGKEELRRELRSDNVRKGNAASSSKRQSGNSSKDVGKLDLNVEFSNEVEETAQRVRDGHGPGHGEEDGIEGIGFFEGLDEFLSSLPILSVVGDDKAKAS